MNKSNEHLSRMSIQQTISEKGYCRNCDESRIFIYKVTKYKHHRRYDFYQCKRCGDIKEAREIKLSGLEKE